MRRRVMDNSDVDVNTLLLLHFDGNVIDNSKLNRQVFVQGSAAYVTGKYGQSFNATNTRFAYVDNAEWFKELMNSEEFTIDAWVTVNDVFTIGLDDGTTNSFVLMLWKTEGRFQFGTHRSFGFGGFQANVSIPSGFIHVAVVLKSGIVKLYLNGTLVAQSRKLVYTFPINTLSIGSRMRSPSQFNSYIDELRVSNIARWTSNFTPPTRPY